MPGHSPHRGPSRRAAKRMGNTAYGAALHRRNVPHQPSECFGHCDIAPPIRTTNRSTVTTTTTIAKTTYVFEVLHPADQPPVSLQAALEEADSGNAVGSTQVLSTVRLRSEDVPDELRRLGNDGKFFDDEDDPHDDQGNRLTPA